MGTPDGILVGGLIAALSIMALRHGWLHGRHQRLKETLDRVRRERDEARDNIWRLVTRGEE